MIAGVERGATLELETAAVLETQTSSVKPASPHVAHVCPEGEGSQRKHGVEVGHQPDLFIEEHTTVLELCPAWSVSRRCTLHGGCDVAVVVGQPVVNRFRDRHVCKASRMQSPDKEPPGRVTGKDPPRAIASVSRGSDAKHEESSVEIPEPRNGPPPVVLPPKGRSRANAFPKAHKPRATPAADDPAPQGRGRRLTKDTRHGGSTNYRKERLAYGLCSIVKDIRP